MKTSSWLSGLMLKDLLNLRPMTKTLVFMFLIFGIVFIPMGNTMTVYFLLMIFAALLPMTSLTMDDMAKWDRYALTMPVTRKDIVTSKYLMTIIFFCVSILISGIIAGVSYYLMPANATPFWFIVLVGALGVFYGSLLFPLLYKFGSEKARYMMFVLMAVIGILLVGWFALFGESLTGNLLIYILITAVVSVAAFIASYFVSVRLYEKKEF
ncbi:MAG: ABC-2 transporter permease [Methanocorpusculum sp.]|uniref:ABC-2 transporter permease n=1 Tax=Methanocorpusculum sp. TaxID=2058474 RepID=UPI00272842FF|nr:ABC-2 transporter permease [Methanocorpusculum sp.]MDO9522176.1 ABC-2 transporter permease [Methanocorpusculum sp.]